MNKNSFVIWRMNSLEKLQVGMIVRKIKDLLTCVYIRKAISFFSDKILNEYLKINQENDSS